jgi:hypothetical protein
VTACEVSILFAILFATLFSVWKYSICSPNIRLTCRAELVTACEASIRKYSILILEGKLRRVNGFLSDSWKLSIAVWWPDAKPFLFEFFNTLFSVLLTIIHYCWCFLSIRPCVNMFSLRCLRTEIFKEFTKANSFTNFAVSEILFLKQTIYKFLKVRVRVIWGKSEQTFTKEQEREKWTNFYNMC